MEKFLRSRVLTRFRAVLRVFVVRRGAAVNLYRREREAGIFRLENEANEE